MSNFGPASGVYPEMGRRLIYWPRSSFRFCWMHDSWLKGDSKTGKKTLARYVATDVKHERRHPEDDYSMEHFDRDLHRCSRKTPQYRGTIFK